MIPAIRMGLLSVALAGNTGSATELDLFDGFSDRWRDAWQEQRLALRSTTYTVDETAGSRALRAVSRSANAGLVRRIEVARPEAATLRWRWKITRTLPHSRNERTRGGDDYAARVFVVFETSVIPLRTRAINYVWSAREPVGARFLSPYTKNVGLCVIRSGDGDAGRWLAETRDVLADYRHFFGEPASQISAVAVSVDTDNTETEGEAWFADLFLLTKPAPKSKGEVRPFPPPPGGRE